MLVIKYIHSINIFIKPVSNYYIFVIFSIKLGIIEDPANRSRLAKLLRFGSSADPKEMTNLADYVSRMKPKQEHIYYMAGSSRSEVCNFRP